MSVAKVTEITSSSTKSFEDAIAKGIERADQTLDNVTGAWVQDMKVDVTKGKVSNYRVNMKITFILKDKKKAPAKKKAKKKAAKRKR